MVRRSDGAGGARLGTRQPGQGGGGPGRAEPQRDARVRRGDRAAVNAAPVVLKYGGELVEDAQHLRTAVASIAAAVEASIPLVIVHGGGRAVDAALKAAGIEKRQVDGLRITDDATLGVVVSVL